MLRISMRMQFWRFFDIGCVRYTFLHEKVDLLLLLLLLLLRRKKGRLQLRLFLERSLILYQLILFIVGWTAIFLRLCAPRRVRQTGKIFLLDSRRIHSFFF